MNLQKTDKLALAQAPIPCRKCGAETELINCETWDDPRTQSYCEIGQEPIIQHLAQMPYSPDISFDVYKCKTCKEYTADLAHPMWIDDATGSFYLWQDMDAEPSQAK